MDIVVLLNKKIEEGRSLIAGIETMREVPSRAMNVVSKSLSDSLLNYFNGTEAQAVEQYNQNTLNALQQRGSELI